MPHVGFTEFRQNLASHLDEVAASRAPLLVTRQKAPSVVVIAEEEYEGMMETIHLLSSPKNAQRLVESIAELNAGRGEEHEIVDPE